MPGIWFFPPLTFGVVLAAVAGMSLYMKKLAFRGPAGPGAATSYACGEDIAQGGFSPDYSQFFSFAFFFSIMHVVALMVATMPAREPGELFLPVLYIAGALVGLGALLKERT